MDVLAQIFNTLKVDTEIFHNGQYCGNWAIDTSGSQFISFHLVTHGRCFLKLDHSDKVEVLEQGDLVLFPRDARHCLTSDDSFSLPVNTEASLPFDIGLKSDGTGLVCGYFAHQHPLMEQLTAHMPEWVIVRELHNPASALAHLLSAILLESRQAAPGETLTLERIAEAILALVFRDHLSVDTGVLAALAHPRLRAAIEAVHADSQKKWSVEQLAGVCHLSRAGFAEAFKQVVGIPPMDYVTQWRLSLAYRQLADSDTSVLAAALAAGYDNESSFSKAFKRVMGITPGAVRAGKVVTIASGN